LAAIVPIPGVSSAGRQGAWARGAVGWTQYRRCYGRIVASDLTFLSSSAPVFTACVGYDWEQKAGHVVGTRRTAEMAGKVTADAGRVM